MGIADFLGSPEMSRVFRGLGQSLMALDQGRTPNLNNLYAEQDRAQNMEALRSVMGQTGLGEGLGAAASMMDPSQLAALLIEDSLEQRRSDAGRGALERGLGALGMGGVPGTDASLRGGAEITPPVDQSGLSDRTRRFPIGPEMESTLASLAGQIGPDVGVSVTSGGQLPDLPDWVDRGRTDYRTGSTRHDIGEHGHAGAADIVLTRNGRPVTPTEDPALYERFFALASPHFPGMGHYDGFVHVGGGSPAFWGPDGTAATADPRFAAGLGQSTAPTGLAQGLPPEFFAALSEATDPAARQALMMAGEQWLAQQTPPEAPEREIRNDQYGMPRYVDTGEPVYPDAGAMPAESPKDEQPEQFRDMIDQERFALGLPEGVYQRGPNNRIYRVGENGVRTEVTIEAPSPASAWETQPDDVREQFVTFRDAATNAMSTITSLDMMEQALSDPNFYSGAGAETGMLLRRWGVTLGLSDPDSIASTEMFQSRAYDRALSAMGGSLGVGFSNADREFVIGMGPNLSNTVEGNRRLIEVMRRIERRKIEMFERAQEYRREHGGVIDDDFSSEILRWAEANPLFGDMEPATERSLSDYTLDELRQLQRELQGAGQ